MTYKLHVIERIKLMQILPKESSYSTFKILLTLKSALSFTEEEYKEFGMREEEGMIHWNKSEEKEIIIGERALDIIKEAFRELDKQKKITEAIYPLYEKFMIEK
jgi:hypothetical protein